MSSTRVYHPTANTWQDVPDVAVKEWTGAGWTTTKPEHVDDSLTPLVQVETLTPGSVTRMNERGEIVTTTPPAGAVKQPARTK